MIITHRAHNRRDSSFDAADRCKYRDLAWRFGDSRSPRWATIPLGNVVAYVPAETREHRPPDVGYGEVRRQFDTIRPDLCAETGRDPEARRAQKAYYAKKSVEDRAEEKLRVLEDIFRLHGERALVFAGSNAMAMDVSRRFLVPTILSHSRKRERLAVLGGFEKGRFPVIVANRVLDEGVDMPEAKVAVVIGGQSSTRQAKQRLGRILRKTGAARATLYEVVCQDTREVERSRDRRRSDAYVGTRYRRI